jgi:hypothetical protein
MLAVLALAAIPAGIILRRTRFLEDDLVGRGARS